MRYLVAGLVVTGAFTSVRADPVPATSQQWERPNTAGVFLDIGGGWERLHPPNGVTYRSEYLRIAPSISLHRFLYLGAAFDIGNIYGAYGSNDMEAAVSANDYTDENNGSTLSGQVFLGARELIGIFSVGGEVAPTLRSTSAGMNFEYTQDKTFVTTVEIHGKADAWLTSHITVGVLAGMDIDSIRDFQAGLQVGFHVEPYDAMNR
jgi:hypothetical protein